ncbi:MAG: glycosyltransferase family 4 protein [Gammaproteobacteria bacterium]|nr:glycosyltransferase family 4 protein [Gammaproteobacteria bacterium]
MPIRVALIASFGESVVQFRGALIAELLRRGAEVTVVVPPCEAATRRGIEELGVDVVVVPMNRNAISPLMDVITLLQLVKILRLIRPTHVLCYTIKPVIFGSAAARLAGVPSRAVLITGLGLGYTGSGFKARSVGFVVRVLLRGALRLCQTVIFQNDDDRILLQKRRMVRAGTRVTTVNGSGVPLRHFAPEPLPDKVAFLMIARFVREKGVLEYLRAAEIVHGRYPKIPVRLLGWADEGVAGMSQSEVDARARAAGVEVLPRTGDVRPAMRDCAVLVLPSYREGTPRTVLEAMAMARPVITTDVPGCRQTVEVGQTGWLVGARDAESLAEAMFDAIRSAGRLEIMGRAGRRRAEAMFDADSVGCAMADAMGVEC